MFSSIFKKILWLFVLISTQLAGQTIENPIVNNAGAIQFSGKGKFSGNKDSGKGYRQKVFSSGDIYFDGYFDSFAPGAANTSLAGIGFRNEIGSSTSDGSTPLYGIFVTPAKIYTKIRATKGGLLLNRDSANVTMPIKLKIARSGNNFKAYYSKTAKGSSTYTWIELTTIQNAFAGWSDPAKAILVGSGNTTSTTTVNLSEFSLGTLNPAPSNSCDFTDGQIIANTRDGRQIKARKFNSKWWVAFIGDNPDEFFVRGRNYLTRPEVISIIPSAKYTCFEGENTSYGGLGEPGNWIIPDGYELHTQPDGARYYKPISQLPACDCGFSIVSASQIPGQNGGTYQFASCNAVTHNWKLLNGSAVIASGTKNATTSTISFDIPTSVNSGNYTLKVSITNCSGEGSIAFSYQKPGVQPDGTLQSVPLIALVGESNAGGRALNSQAPSSELGLRLRTNILNNTTLNFEQLNIGVNNNLDDYQSENGTHGAELELANAINNGTINENILYLVKSGQGGSLIGQWSEGLAYWDKFVARIDAAKNQIAQSGKVAKPIIFYSQGINDVIAGIQTADSWKTLTMALHARIRSKLGANTPIVMTKFWGEFSAYNSKMDEIVASNPNTYVIETSDASRKDIYHFDYSGMKLVTDRFIAKYNQLFGTVSPSPDNSSGNENSWVLHPNGYKMYDRSGNVMYTAMNVQLSGSNQNIITETIQRGCPAGYQRMYSFDEGNYLSSNNYGWLPGTPQNVAVEVNGKVIKLTIACVGSQYWQDVSVAGSGVKDVYQEVIYIKKNTSINRNGNGVTYLSYPATFKPTQTSNLPQFLKPGVFPSFNITGKFNIYQGVFPTDKVSVDLGNFGISAWHLKNGAPFAASKNYVTDPDSWTGSGGFGSFNGNSFNNLSTAEARNKGALLASTYNGFGAVLRDDEWRQGIAHTEQGKLNELNFFQQASLTSPNTYFGAHHNAPYNVPAYRNGSFSDDQINKIFDPALSKDQFVSQGLGFHGVYWENVIGQANGENAGKYMKITSINAYTSTYNPPKHAEIMQQLMGNQRFWGDKFNLATLMGTHEVTAGQNQFEMQNISWNWPGGGTSEKTWTRFSGAMSEFIGFFSNLLGGGWNYWGPYNSWQDSRPDVYLKENDFWDGTVPENQRYIPNQSTLNSITPYQKVWAGDIDYLIAGTYKYSLKPSDVDVNNLIMYEISTDGGASWRSGSQLYPIMQEKAKKPIAYGLKNASGSKHFVGIIFPQNDPTKSYSFMIRHNDFGTKTVWVNGVWPEVLLITPVTSN